MRELLSPSTGSAPGVAKATRAGARAHSWVEVMQRAAGNSATASLMVQRVLTCPRFAFNDALQIVETGAKWIGLNAAGPHITIVQQALADAGVPDVGITGVVDGTTVQALQAFQRQSAVAVTGRLDKATITALDALFSTHAPERRIATDAGRALDEGTRVPGPSEKQALDAALTTEQRAAGGRGGMRPPFHQKIARHPVPYEVRVKAALVRIINAQHARYVEARPERTEENLLSGDAINAVSAVAKHAVDQVFGRYLAGPTPALTFGVNIIDQFESRHALLESSGRARNVKSRWRVDKLLTGHQDIKAIDRQHGAVQSRKTEKALIDTVRAEVIDEHMDKLLAIHENWSGSSAEGKIHLQRYLGGSAAANRTIMWKLFGTVIHEYLHTLEHADHVAHRKTLEAQRGGFVLREGTVDYFARTVWDGLTFDTTLRKAVEGPFHDPDNPTGHPIPVPTRYAESVNAERAAGIVGARNLMLAFFGGRVDLIKVT